MFKREVHDEQLAGKEAVRTALIERNGFGDVVRAYVHARARRRVCVELSKEDCEEGKSGLLKKAMYCARDAAQK